MSASIRVSVVHAPAQGAWFERELVLPAGATIAQAIVASEVLQAYPDWQLEQLAVGVFSVRLPLEAILHDLDRIEIYRALLIDPKDRRVNKVNSTRNAGKWRRFIKKSG